MVLNLPREPAAWTESIEHSRTRERLELPPLSASINPSTRAARRRCIDVDVSISTQHLIKPLTHVGITPKSDQGVRVDCAATASFAIPSHDMAITESNHIRNEHRLSGS